MNFPAEASQQNSFRAVEVSLSAASSRKSRLILFEFICGNLQSALSLFKYWKQGKKEKYIITSSLILKEIMAH